MQNKGPPPPSFNKNISSRPPPLVKGISRRSEEAKEKSKNSVNATTTRSRQRNNFVKQLKDGIQEIASQSLANKRANEIQEEIYKMCGFKQTNREYRDNGGVIKKKISDPRYRHVACKVKEEELDISVFVEEILNAKPEEGVKVKPGQRFPSFLNKPPVLREIKSDQQVEYNSPPGEEEEEKMDQKGLINQEQEEKKEIINEQPATTNEPVEVDSSNLQEEMKMQESHQTEKQDLGTQNLGGQEVLKQQSILPQTTDSTNLQKQKQQNPSEKPVQLQKISQKQQDEKVIHSIPQALSMSKPSTTSTLIQKTSSIKQQTQQHDQKQEDLLNEPKTNRMKMKKAQNELLAILSKPRNPSSKYHPSPSNQRGPIIPRHPSLTQSYIQPSNSQIKKQNTTTASSGEKNQKRESSLNQPQKRPNSRIGLSQTDRKSNTKKNLNHTIAENPNLYHSQQQLDPHQQNQMQQKMILDKYESHSTLSNYNQKSTTSSSHRIKPFNAQQFIQSHKNKQKSAVSTPKNSHRDLSDNNRSMMKKYGNNYTKSNIGGPSQTPSRQGPASITTYNQSMDNLKQAYDTRKRELEETKKLLTKSDLELKAERKKAELLNEENNKLQDQMHKLKRKKKKSNRKGEDDDDDDGSSSAISSEEQKSNQLARKQEIELQKLKKQLNISQSEIVNLKNQLQAKTKAIESMNKANQEINNRFKTYKEEMDNTINKLTTNMQKKNQKSQQQQQQQQTSAQKLRAQANAYQAQLTRLKEECKKLREDNESLKRNPSHPQLQDDTISPQNYSLRSNSNRELPILRQESDIAPASITSAAQNNASRNSSSLSQLHPSLLPSVGNNQSMHLYSSEQISASIRDQENAPDMLNDQNIIYQSGSGFQQYQPMIVPPSSSGSADHRAPGYPTIINQDTGQYHLVSVTDAIGGGAGAADSVQDSQYQHQSQSGGAGDFFGQRTTFTHLYSHQQQQNPYPYHSQYPQGDNIQNSSGIQIERRSTNRNQINVGYRNQETDNENAIRDQNNVIVQDDDDDDDDRNINPDDGEDIIRNSGQGQGMGGMHTVYDQRAGNDQEEQKKWNTEDKSSKYLPSEYGMEGESGGIDQFIFGNRDNQTQNQENESQNRRSSDQQKQNIAGGSGGDIGARLYQDEEENNQIDWNDDDQQEQKKKYQHPDLAQPSSSLLLQQQNNWIGQNAQRPLFGPQASPQVVSRQQFNQSGSGGGKSQKQKEKSGESGSTALVESNRRVVAEQRKNVFAVQEDKKQQEPEEQQQFSSGIGQTNQEEYYDRIPQQASSGAVGELIHQQRDNINNNVLTSTSNGNHHSIFQMIDQFVSPSSSQSSAIINNRNGMTGGGLFNEDPSQSSGQAVPASAITPVVIQSQFQGGAPASSTTYESRSRSPATIPRVDMQQQQQQQQQPINGLPFQFQETREELQDIAPASSSGMSRGNEQNSVPLRSGVQNTGATGNSYQTNFQEEEKFIIEQHKNFLHPRNEGTKRGEIQLQATRNIADSRRRQEMKQSQKKKQKQSPPIPSNLFQSSSPMNLLDLSDNNNGATSNVMQQQQSHSENIQSVPGNLFSITDLFSNDTNTSSTTASQQQSNNQLQSLFGNDSSSSSANNPFNFYQNHPYPPNQQQQQHQHQQYQFPPPQNQFNKPINDPFAMLQKK